MQTGDHLRAFHTDGFELPNCLFLVEPLVNPRPIELDHFPLAASQTEEKN